MIEEIKPVLTAILDLLERSLERPAVALENPPAQAPRDPFRVEELLRLPEILTRPLEELITPVSEAPAGPPGAGAAGPSEDSNDPGPSQRPAKRDRRDVSGSALPGIYAWTNLFA